MLAATLEYSTLRETDRATVTSTLLTQIDDALTAAAIVIGGAFAYLMFIRGRVLTAAVGYEIRASVTAHAVQRRHMPRQPFNAPPVGALLVEVAIRNNGQLAITVPRDSEQLVSVSSITADELARHGHDLTQELGLEPGPLFKRLLDAVREAQLDGTVQTREQALELVKRLLAAEDKPQGGPSGL